MGWVRRLFSRGDDAALTMRAQPRTGAAFSLNAPQDLLDAIAGSGQREPRISRDEALQVPAVLKARNMIAGTLCTLPIRYHDPERRVVPWPLVDQIDPDIAPAVTKAMLYEDLLFEGISWWRVIAWGWHTYPIAARHVPISSVYVGPNRNDLRPWEQRINPDQPWPVDGQVYIDGVPITNDNEIIRFDSPNPPLLVHAAGAIRTALRLQQATRMYAEDPMPQSHFEQAEGSEPLDDDEIEQLLDDWSAARKKRSTAYTAALKLVHDQWDPKKLQLVEAKDQVAKEIAIAAGLDTEDVGVSTTSRTYANIEQARQDRKTNTLGAYVQTVQERLSMHDVAQRGYVSRIAWDGFLRSDTATRIANYTAGLPIGVYTDEEIRELEDKPSLTPAQRARVEQRAAPAAPPTEEPQMSGPQAAPEAMRFGFAGDTSEATTVTFDLSADAVNFRVNAEKRTISGLAVPWNKVAYSRGQKWRFLPGSLHWTEPSRVKANLDHDHERLVGKAVRLEPTQVGLDTSVQLGRSPEAKRALEDAEDGIFDGFSIEIQFHEAAGDKVTADPDDRSVNLVHRATLSGIALTPMPSFDDARVTAVAASKTGDTKVTAPKTADVAAAAAGDGAQFNFDGFMTGLADKIAESHKKLTGELGESIGQSVAAGFKTALEALPAPQNGPGTVRAARFTVTREAPVYAFNGLGHSLVRDAWYAARERDDDAIERLRKYRQQTEEIGKLAAAHVGAQFAGAQFAPQSTSTAAAIIPPGYRPDLYVAELMKGRPMVNACSRGVIANATPFTVPVFTSSTNATADHVEGTNPTDGSLDLDTKTVTPAAISGRLLLTREIVDSSNPAIDQIALATMRESYARQTEAKVYTLLNGANGVGGVITAGLVPSGAQASTVVAPDTDAGKQALVKHIRSRLAAYPFNRFAAPEMALMGQNATSRLATAVDTSQRPLLPSIGAQNTSGLGNAITQGWSVDGLPHVPAWAMTDTAAGDSQIIIVNGSDVWVWESPLLTFRFEEKQGPANIELNVFGYFGSHVLRPVGLSGIRMTDA